VAELSIPNALAPVNLAQLHDSEGRLVLLPATTVAWFKAMGAATITLTIPLTVSDEPAEWITSAEAAERRMFDLTMTKAAKLTAAERAYWLQRARVDVGRACKARAVESIGKGRDRRINSRSLDAWRMQMRDAPLLAEDEADED